MYIVLICWWLCRNTFVVVVLKLICHTPTLLSWSELTEHSIGRKKERKKQTSLYALVIANKTSDSPQQLTVSIGALLQKHIGLTTEQLSGQLLDMFAILFNDANPR